MKKILTLSAILYFCSISQADAEKAKFTRYFVITTVHVGDVLYTVEGIQHYKDDEVRVDNMSVTRMWRKNNPKNQNDIMFTESANITPDGKIDFQNIFTTVASGERCIEKNEKKENLDEYKRGAAPCSSEMLGRSRALLAIGEREATEKIEEMRHRDKLRKNKKSGVST